MNEKDMITEMHAIILEVRKKLHLFIQHSGSGDYTRMMKQMDNVIVKLRDEKLIS